MNFFSKYKRDILLVAALLVIGAAGAAFLLLTAEKGAVVQVSVNTEIVAEYPLDKDLTTIIEGYDGGTNTLVIEGGEAWVTHASCPDHVCEGMGRISRDGESVICLPNRLVVEIVGGEDTGVDFAAG